MRERPQTRFPRFGPQTDRPPFRFDPIASPGPARPGGGGSRSIHIPGPDRSPRPRRARVGGMP